VLVKASAGGGGKGMRIVRATRELAAAIAGAGARP
jgi:biotin carboxylase